MQGRNFRGGAENLRGGAKNLSGGAHLPPKSAYVPHYWRSDAIDSKLTTVSILLSCLLENHATTRETLCQNNNPLFEMLSKSATHQQTSLWNSYKQRFDDIKLAYSLNITKLSKSRHKRNFDAVIEQILLIGHFYRILKSPWGKRKDAGAYLYRQFKRHLLSVFKTDN